MAPAIRVLYVDDEQGLLTISKIFLERGGSFTVDTCTSARDALARLKTERYDAIVSDYQMPEMDGIGFLKQLKISESTTPFIIFTGKGREEVVIEALNEGADFYIQKGGDPKSQFAELSNKIRYAVTRKKVEEELSESQKRTAEIIEFLPDATFAINTEGVVIAWNRAMEIMTGLEKEQVLNKGDYEYSLPFYGERRPILINLVLDPDEMVAGKYPFIRKEGNNTISEIYIPHFHDGQGAYLWFTASPLYNSQGVLSGAIESIRDITEQKRAEDALVESEVRYRHVVEDQTEFICRFLPDGTHVFVNEAYCRYYGMNRDDIIGTRFQPNIHPEDRGRVARLIASLTVDQPLMTIDQRTIMPDGNTRWQRWVDRAIFQLDGSLKEYQSVGRDITATKQDEAALRESEERFRTLLEQVQAVAVQGYLPDYTVVYWNEANTHMYGYTAEEAIGRDIRELLVPVQARDAVTTAINRMAETGIPEPSAEHELLHKDGSRVPVFSSHAVVKIPGKSTVQFCFDIGISDRKVVEDALRESEEKYRALSTMMRLMCDNVPDMIWAKDLEKRFIFVNKALCNGLLSAANTDEPVGKNDLFFAERERTRHANDPEWYTFGEVCRDTDQVTMDAGTPQQFDEFGNVQGNYLFLDVHKAPFLDEHGKMIGTVGSARDVTESKLLEVALLESESFNRGLVENLPDYIAVYGQDGNLLYVNPASVKGLGYDADMLVGTHVLTYVAPEYRDTVTAKMATRWRGGDKSPYEIDLVTKSGHRRSVIVKATPIQYKHNSAVLLLLIDITERKMAEDVTRRSEEKYREIFEHSVTGAFQTAPGGRIISVNEAFAQMYGFLDPAEMLAADLNVGSPSYANPEDRQEVLHILGEMGIVENYEALHLKRDGTKFWASINARTIRDADGSVLFYEGTILDITKRKQDEGDIIAALKRTQDQQAALGMLSFSPALFSGDVLGLSARITEVSSGVLGVDRASVWLFNDKQDELRCIDLYEVLYDRHSCDGVLKRHQYVNEFDALSQALYIDAGDPLTDPRTAGYVDGYLKPNRITSMLDAVIRVSGQNLGVICFEHVDRSHQWERDEIAFACQLADQVAITMLNHSRKLAEEALRESDRLFREVFNNANDSVFLLKRTPGGPRKYFLVNDKAVQMLGYSKEELLEMSPQDIVPEDVAKKIMPEVIKKLLRDGHVNFESVHRRKDGCTYPVEVSTNTFRYMGEYVDLSITRDITERKRAEYALAESEKKYRSIIENISDGFYRVNEQGKIAMVSPSCARIFGYNSADEVVGLPLEWFWTQPEHRDELARIMQVNGIVTDFEVLARKKDGTTVLVAISCSFYRDTNECIKGYEGIIRDITERKRAEEAIRQANKKLTLLTGITRHDINNQLTVLRGYLSILEEQQPDATHNEYFLKVSTAAQHISAMIQFTKEYEEIGVNTPAWQDCRTLVDTAAEQAPLGQVMVKNDLPANAEVFADPLVVKVFYNLMDNAVRYGGKTTFIRFSALESGDAHLIVCEDDGVGVVAEEKAKIFNRGFGKNTGLGLALSQEILSITGITFRETGAPGKGARFELVVPKGAWRMAGKDVL